VAAQTLDYVIIFSQGFVIAILGYFFIAQGRNLIQPEARIKSASQMITAGLALVFMGLIVGAVAAVLLILNR
jgi:hypothetical protein